MEVRLHLQLLQFTIGNSAGLKRFKLRYSPAVIERLQVNRCDETNNTDEVISANQLICDVYIKPTYIAEFILLRFTNAGVNSFTDVLNT